MARQLAEIGHSVLQCIPDHRLFYGHPSKDSPVENLWTGSWLDTLDTALMEDPTGLDALARSHHPPKKRLVLPLGRPDWEITVKSPANWFT